MVSFFDRNPFQPLVDPDGVGGFIRKMNQREREQRMLGSTSQLDPEPIAEEMTVARLLEAARHFVPKYAELLEEAELHTGASQEIATLSLLCAFSMAGQGAYDAIDHRGKRTPIGLHGVGVAPSGLGKSSFENYAFAPFHAFEDEHSRAYMNADSGYRNEMVLWTSEKKRLERILSSVSQNTQSRDQARQDLIEHLEKVPKPDIPPFALIASRMTPALLQDRMGVQPVVAIVTSESESFFNGYGMRDLSLINEFWDGTSQAATGRKKVVRPRLAICAWGQPSVLRQFLTSKGGKARDMGTFARMLFVQAKREGRRFESDSVSDNMTRIYSARVNALLKETVDVLCGGTVKDIVLSDDAKRYLVETERYISDSTRSYRRLADVVDCAGKLPSNILRIAASLNLFFSTDQSREISVYEIQFASWYASYFAQQFVELFSKKNTGAALANELIKSLERFAWRGYERATRRDILTSGCPSVRNAEALDVAIQWLPPEWRGRYKPTPKGMAFYLNGIAPGYPN